MSTSKIVISISILLSVVLVGYGLFFRGNEIVNYPPKEGSIVAFGDSLVEGVGSPQTEGFVLPLSQLIHEPIINLGVAGNTTEDALARVELVTEQNPRLVLVLLGGNDYLRRMPAEETFANLHTIITTLQNEGALVVLLGVRGGVLKDNYESEYQKLAKATGAVYVPNVLDDIFGDTALMSDSVHPNKDDYKLIAEKIYQEIKPVLR